MENKKIKIMCPLTCTKCDMFCFKFDNCKYKNSAILNKINNEILKTQQK